MVRDISDPENIVRVARIGKPHGIKGEVTVEVFTDSPEKRFAVGNTVTVGAVPGQHPAFDELTIENTRWNKKILLVKFSEFSDRDTAESLRNFQLYVRAEKALGHDEGWYASDLVGFAVFLNTVDSTQIGAVTDLVTGRAQDLLEIRLEGGEQAFIPFVTEIVPEIDAVRGAVVITPPPGLLELNQD